MQYISLSLSLSVLGCQVGFLPTSERETSIEVDDKREREESGAKNIRTPRQIENVNGRAL